METTNITGEEARSSQPRATVSLGTSHFQEANAIVRAALAQADAVELHDVFAQRYLGCTMPAGKRLEIHGTPGNDMACYMDGGDIEVFGNAQDQIGNTMNDGRIVVHGRCGDAAGYAMRGGTIIVRDGCGWRVGIHMKQYGHRRPAIVIGGDAGNFLGEYMAGGVIVLLGHPGEYLACGMHGGVIYLRQAVLPAEIPAELTAEPLGDDDRRVLGDLLDQYDTLFAGEPRADGRTARTQAADERAAGEPTADGRSAGEPRASWNLADFVALRPASSRPYAALYAS